MTLISPTLGPSIWTGPLTDPRWIQEEREATTKAAIDALLGKAAYKERLKPIKRKLKFLGVAQAVADLSKDRSTKVGALVLDDELNILSVGYNGFPRCVDDDVESRHERPAKYAYTSHAEENSIAQAARNGIKLVGSTILITSLYPCSRCARMIIQAGISTVLAPKGAVDDRWMLEWEVSKEMFKEAGVGVVLYNPEDTDYVEFVTDPVKLS